MNAFDKVSLGVFPTPLTRLPNVSRKLGTNIWIKRDDMTGVALGGNKVRKLEYLLADARKKGYRLVMTTGQAQSNHAMLTAACASKLGMDCVLVLKKRGITERKGNQVLNYLMGTDVRFVDTDDYNDIYREMDRIADEYGEKVYKIPCGGSNALGTLGYVDCVREIASSGIRFDYIGAACGSGGTVAGIGLGTALYMPETKIVCPTVDNDAYDRIVPQLIREAAELIGEKVTLPEIEYVNMTGEGYSIPSAPGNEAIAMMMKLEGIVLDPCYTGKAFAGIVRKAREGAFLPTDNVLFIHTGGAGGLFARDWD